MRSASADGLRPEVAAVTTAVKEAVQRMAGCDIVDCPQLWL